jgi:hypothetical protein
MFGLRWFKMGERAGYRVVEITKGGKRIESWIARKQWYLGGSKVDLESWVRSIAETLMVAPYGGNECNINGGMVALRDDLNIGRLFASMVRVTLGDCFASLETTINCDIDDHGLYEVELKKWNLWDINHYETSRKRTQKEFEAAKKQAKKGEHVSAYVWGELQPKRKLGTVEFTEGKTLADGIKFNWAKNFKEY